MHRWALVWFALISGGTLWAQPALYELFPQGSIPASFLASGKQVFSDSHPKLESYVPEKRAQEETYYWEQAYVSQQLLRSGKVLFNDSVSRYLERVADQLLRVQPQLRSELEFYAVRSPYVNAYSSGRGFILVNVGLIAQLQSEAELGYILSHEIAHFVKQHGLRLFLERTQSGTGLRPGIDKKVESLINENRWSQAMELEADRWGTRLFLSSGYDLGAVARSYELLTKADLPFFQADYHHAFLLPQGVSWPSRWAQDSLNMTEQWSSFLSDSLGSHPIPQKRQALSLAQIAPYQLLGRPAFLQEPPLFWRIRDLCRYTTARLLLQEHLYEDALIYLHDLSTRYEPAQLAADRNYAWYALAKHANAGRFYDVHRSSEGLSGAHRMLVQFTEELSPQQLNEIALIALFQQDSSSSPTWWRACSQDLRAEWQDLYGQDGLSSWFREVLEHNPSFRTWLRRTISKEKVPVDRRSVILPADRRQLTAGQRKDLVQGLDLDLGKILLVEPGFYHLDERYPYALQFETSLTQQQQMSRLSQNYCNELGLPYQLLSQEKWGPGDVQSLNDLAV
ncbi:MAG: M48 family metallopeptidase, partial [Bacteroidota bacterium]